MGKTVEGINPKVLVGLLILLNLKAGVFEKNFLQLEFTLNALYSLFL